MYQEPTTYDVLKSQNMDKQTYTFILRHYDFSPERRELFFWIWRNTQLLRKTAQCKKRQRYIGFYNEYDEIFAYVDAQEYRFKIGIERRLLRNLDLSALDVEDFPEWSNKDMRGITVRKRDEQVIDVLVLAHDRR